MSASIRANRRRAELPPSFVSIRDILGGSRRVGSFVNVVGVVVDSLDPVATRGEDWKCRIKLCDRLNADDDDDDDNDGDGVIHLNVFRPQNEMPDVGPCDIVILFKAKIQQFSSEPPSLITNFSTDIHVYSAETIPPPPLNALRALKPATRKINRRPDQVENAYISSLFHAVDSPKFEVRIKQTKPQTKSTIPAKKFKELKEVEDRAFVDLIVQIVKQPYNQGDMCTVWVSDYTANDNFFNFAFKGLHLDNPFGYNTGANLVDQNESGWTGPYGKLSLQLSIFEPHASVIRDRNLDVGDWVKLRNVQIKFGNNGSNLEGFLREDRNSHGNKVNVIPMDPREDPDSIDPLLKEALRRKRDYERAKKKQLKELREAAQAGKKRKTDLNELEDPKLKSKKKRQAKRAQRRAKSGETKEVDQTREEAKLPKLNPQVKCEHQNKPASSVEDLLQAVSHRTIVEGEELQLELPFINANYRINARVVNFQPSRLEDFARPKKPSEYGSLSDHESDTSESEMEETGLDSFRPRQWEWRFFLELEDATMSNDKNNGEKQNEKKGKNSVWVVVDNQSAQCLLDLDATDLRSDPENLEALRQRLFLLWGELEEHKTRESEENERKMRRSASSNGPPAHSSDDEGVVRPEVINRPFACCIRQYGVKLPESDPCKADAGDGRRWQRMFGMFGTRISG